MKLRSCAISFSLYRAGFHEVVRSEDRLRGASVQYQNRNCTYALCTSTSQGLRRYKRVESHYLSTASVYATQERTETGHSMRGQAFHLSTMAQPNAL